ncbi:DUF4278 domain-containing protein [Oscillatoria sp. FACHB-1407]|uniref:DUF4278 domain-containing protein n=1 Tax=Oscillatoria sp. FACHB-1407 TaxID=2692847 RepID=UPI0035CD38E0
MLLRYRGIPYHVSSSSIRHCTSVSSAIVLNYRGTAYLIERSASTRWEVDHKN